jgi:hypothetical protein
MEIKKAVKTRQKLRLAIDGVSGSGKTYTALSIASGMGGPIIVIDSEHGSASLYADRFTFDTIELNQFQIEDYIAALEMAACGNDNKPYHIVIIDSTSHAWDALIERVERIANQKYGGNTFRAWGEGTPLQKKLIEAMLNYPGHVIVTCRSKTEYSVEKNEKGATTIKKVGTAAVQRQGFEYEFTMAMTMDANHVGFVTKDRTGKFQDKFIEKPGKEMGGKLIAWLNEGDAPPPPPPKSIERQCHDEMVKIGNILNSVSASGERYFANDEYTAVKEKLKSFLKEPPESRLALISNLLGKQNELLMERIEFFKSIMLEENSKPEQPPAAPEPPPPSVSAKQAETAPAQEQGNPDIPAMYEEQEGRRETEEAAEDDGFTDDTPWKDDSPSKGPSKKTSRKPPAKRSLSEEFRNRVNSAPPKPAAGAELDIY